MDKIEVDENLFEMILDSLANQKHIEGWVGDRRDEAQRGIDVIWNRGMGVLREYQQKGLADDIKMEEFQEGGPRVVADIDWTVEQRKEIIVILGGLSAELDRSKEIVDKGYREWARCGMYNKCAQLIELKVSEWDKVEGTRCLLGYIDDQIDQLGRVDVKSDYQRGLLRAYELVKCECSEICGG